MHGIAEITAAKILGRTGAVERFPSRHHYASYAGTAPVEASSGDRVRHRLNRGGDRRLNSAVHQVAVTQARCGPGREHYLRKLSEGKTKREALRSLKRHLTNVIFRSLLADHHARTVPTTERAA